MSESRSAIERGCPGPEVLMLFLDGQLEPGEKAQIDSHMAECAPCRALARELQSTSAALTVCLHCLDDEAVAAYVEHTAAGAKQHLKAMEYERARQHLNRCRQCRERVQMLRQACAPHADMWQWARELALSATRGLAAVRSRPTVMHRSLRWAAVAAVAATAVLGFYLAASRLGQPQVAPGAGAQVATAPTDRRVESVPVEKSPTASGMQRGPAATPVAPSEEPMREGPVTPERPAEDEKAGPEADRLVPSSVVRPTETALVPKGTGIDPEAAAAAAHAADEQARKSGSAEARAKAAFQLASVYHKQGDYRRAADLYEEAAAAAGRANRTELRVDALILLGSVRAELGEAAQARQQFDLALQFARQAGYTKGEQNAVVQLRLLDYEAEAAAPERTQ